MADAALGHPQALRQCDDYIKRRGYATETYSNTAMAAEYVRRTNDPALAAIASEDAAEVFGLQVLERGINTAKTNTTRFAVLCPGSDRPHCDDAHCVLTFTVRNQAGCLAEAIGVIGKYEYNMRVLCSRPMKTLAWQYYFYVEIEGDIDTEKGRNMLEELGGFCDRLRVVGQFMPGRL